MNPDNDIHQNNASAPVSASAERNTLMAVISYLGILVIIPFLTAKNDPFVKFHIKQGLILLIIEVAFFTLGSSLFFLWRFMNLIQLAVFVLVIIGIINAVQGKEKELPLVGSLAKHFKF